MLIGGDDISNDVTTLDTCVSKEMFNKKRKIMNKSVVFWFVLQCLFTFTLIGGNLTAQSTDSHRGMGGGIQIPET